MKKRIVFVVVAMLVLLMIVVGMLIPATVEETIQISAPFQNITSTVLQPERWKQWHPLFEKSDTGLINHQSIAGQPTLVSGKKTITVKEQSPFGIRIVETGGYRELHYSLNVIPQTDETVYVVALRKKVNLLKAVYRSIIRKNENNRDPLLTALKQFIETPEKYYGFPITFGPVVDTIVVSQRKLIAEENLYLTVSEMFEELQHFIEKEKLTNSGHPMLYTSKRGNDSILIMTGMPVDRVQKNDGGFMFQTMPKGRMLIGHFEGNHQSIGKLIDVMRQYISDYSLQPAALPYQKFLDHAIPASPASMVKCDVYYPVF